MILSMKIVSKETWICILNADVCLFELEKAFTVACCEMDRVLASLSSHVTGCWNICQEMLELLWLLRLAHLSSDDVWKSDRHAGVIQSDCWTQKQMNFLFRRKVEAKKGVILWVSDIIMSREQLRPTKGDLDDDVSLINWNSWIIKMLLTLAYYGIVRITHIHTHMYNTDITAVEIAIDDENGKVQIQCM